MSAWWVPHQGTLHVLLALLETASLYLVLSYVYCWSPVLPPLQAEPLRRRSKVTVYAFFTGVAILGSYLGLRFPDGAVASPRAVGAVLAGILGGPTVGVLTGATAGAHALWLGGPTALGDAGAVTLEGLLGGLVNLRLARRPSALVDWRVAAMVTALGETLRLVLLLLASRPFEGALRIVEEIGAPAICSCTVGAALFMIVLRDRQQFFESISAASSAFALQVAKRTLVLMDQGFGREVASEMARIIREETGVGAVAVTDRDRMLAFAGLGADHHIPGRPIIQPQTRRAIATGRVVFADGGRDQFTCRLSPNCPLASVVVVPLQVDNEVVGTVQLYEPEARRFRLMNRTLMEGIGSLLSSQLVLARYLEQKNLLTVAELKLLQAQVNPHFLFNSLNTISAVTRKDPERARQLLVHLSNFFRKNLKRNSDVSTLQEELGHVSSYLEIEKARFGDRLVVETEVDPELLDLRMPTFTLQPLIENAIRHGVSSNPNQGVARIRAYRRERLVHIDIEDNAGTYVQPQQDGSGLGMKIVDRRIKDLLGDAYGVRVHCVPGELTRVTVTLPEEGLPR